MRAILLTIATSTMLIASVSAQELKQRPPLDGGLSAHRAPSDVVKLVSNLQSAGLFDKASSVVEVQRRSYPWDPDLPRIGLELAFLRGRYADMVGYLHMPLEFQQAHPFVWQNMFAGWDLTATLYVAHLNGVKTGRDPEELESQVLDEAAKRRGRLPFGMVDEEGGVHVDKQVLTLLLLRDNFRSHRKLLFDRAAKLAPNDTFILELKAKRLMDEGSAGGPVSLLDQGLAMYKKALKAKASEERIKYLKKELADAEKKVEWLKRVDEIRRRDG